MFGNRVSTIIKTSFSQLSGYNGTCRALTPAWKITGLNFWVNERSSARISDGRGWVWILDNEFPERAAEIEGLKDRVGVAAERS